jgi:ABC-2 type transport system permease protein
MNTERGTHNLAARTIRDELWKSALCFLLLTLLIVLGIWYYPGIKNKGDLLMGLVPKIFSGLVKDFLTGGYDGYIAGQQFFKNVNTICSIFAVLFAVSAIARESERGTLELLLSRPISRTRILLTKFFIAAIGLALPIFLSSVLIIPLSNILIGEHVSLKPLLLSSLHITLFIWLILAASFLLSTIFNDQLKVAGVALSIYVLMILLLVFEQTAHLSIYYYSHIRVYRDIFTGNSYPLLYSALMLAGTILFLGAALFVFRRKDV